LPWSPIISSYKINKTKSILFIFGTRPEAIKCAPVIKEFQKYPQQFKVQICLSYQHQEMLEQMLQFFQIPCDYRLDLMKPNQSIYDITAKGLLVLKTVLKQAKPDFIFVQGDTTTAFIGALAGYYEKIKVAHIEAGLRSNHKYAPYPEEINRTLISQIADYHFAPTNKALQNLKKENICKNVYITGNTGIDALLLTRQIIKEKNEHQFQKYFQGLKFNKKIILITAHRRESFGQPLENICQALLTIAKNNPKMELVFFVHLNPHVKQTVQKLLSQVPNIFLFEPVDYPHLIYLMEKAHFIITDSGGIQEEAPYLLKPVLVIREVTERPEIIKAGAAKLVGTNAKVIIREAEKLINHQQYYQKMQKNIQPYGDGTASKQILDIILKN
jgi:UDP-N-acetylglucosamine 2-epimerase (non-hydrolysing)